MNDEVWREKLKEFNQNLLKVRELVVRELEMVVRN